MIEQLVVNRKTKYYELLEFIAKWFDHDFYYTENNERFYVSNIKTLKTFLRQCCFVYVKKNEHDDILGIAMLWKSIGGGKARYYLKAKVADKRVMKDLITIIMWNTNKEIYAKLRKDNVVGQALREKGFKFIGDRGSQILLCKEARKEDINGRNKYFSGRDKDEMAD